MFYFIGEKISRLIEGSLLLLAIFVFNLSDWFRDLKHNIPSLDKGD